MTRKFLEPKDYADNSNPKDLLRWFVFLFLGSLHGIEAIVILPTLEQFESCRFDLIWKIVIASIRVCRLSVGIQLNFQNWLVANKVR